MTGFAGTCLCPMPAPQHGKVTRCGNSFHIQALLKGCTRGLQICCNCVSNQVSCYCAIQAGKILVSFTSKRQVGRSRHQTNLKTENKHSLTSLRRFSWLRRGILAAISPLFLSIFEIWLFFKIHSGKSSYISEPGSRPEACLRILWLIMLTKTALYLPPIDAILRDNFADLSWLGVHGRPHVPAQTHNLTWPPN